MTITTADISNLLIQNVPQVFADGTTRGTYFSRLIRTLPASKAGGSQWKVKLSGSTAAPVAELDPLPTPSKFTQLDPQLNGAYFAGTIEVSQETMDQIDSGLIVFENYIDMQVEDLVVSLYDQIEQATVGGTNTTNGFVGLDAWVSDTGSPAGISRSTYAGWQAYYNDASGTPRPLTMSHLRDTADTLVGTRQGRFTALVMSPTKASAYSGLSGAGQVQRVFNVNNGDMGSMPPVGVGSAMDVLKPFGYFDEAPTYKIPTMPSDVVWFLDLDAIHYELVSPLKVSAPRPSERRSTIWDVTIGLNLVVPNPYKNCAAVADLS